MGKRVRVNVFQYEVFPIYVAHIDMPRGGITHLSIPIYYWLGNGLCDRLWEKQKWAACLPVNNMLKGAKDKY